MGLGGGVLPHPRLMPPPAPSSSLLHLVGPSLPPCRLQKTTCKDSQFGEASGAPHPCPGLPQTGSGVKRQLGPMPYPHPSCSQGLEPLPPPPLRQAPGRLGQRTLRPDLSPSWAGEPCALTFWSTMEQASCFTWANSEAAGNSTNSRVSPIWMWKETPGPGAGTETWGSRGGGDCRSRPPRGGGDPGPGEPGSPAGWEGAAAMGGPGAAARRPPGIRREEPGSTLYPRELVNWERERGIPGTEKRNLAG